jgi:outer membrane protein assembly factor BamB
MIRPLLLSLCLATAFATPRLNAEDSWPRFLGPKLNNISEAKGLPLTWDKKGTHIKWKVEVPGEGWSSPVTADGRIYLTTALDGGKSIHVLCFAFADGKSLWDVEVFKNETLPPKHARNSYASPTPWLEGDRLYVTFGPMGTACLSTKDGAKLWENRDLVWDQQNGPGGSTSGFGDLLQIPCDGVDVQYEAALSKKDGKLVWKSERSAKPQLAKLSGDMRKAYGTPVPVEFGDKTVTLTAGALRLYALDPATGKEQWFVDYSPGFSNVPIPVSDGKNVYISTGFQKAEIWAIKLEGASGDITQTHVLWKQNKGAPTESTPIVYRERLYMVNSGGIATCLNTADGKVVWQQRLGPDFAATPFVAEGRVYFFDTWNKAYVVEASDTFHLLATNRLDSGCMASPVPIGKALIIRTKTHLHRIEE